MCYNNSQYWSCFHLERVNGEFIKKKVAVLLVIDQKNCI